MTPVMSSAAQNPVTGGLLCQKRAPSLNSTLFSYRRHHTSFSEATGLAALRRYCWKSGGVTADDLKIITVLFFFFPPNYYFLIFLLNKVTLFMLNDRIKNKVYKIHVNLTKNTHCSLCKWKCVLFFLYYYFLFLFCEAVLTMPTQE